MEKTKSYNEDVVFAAQMSFEQGTRYGKSDFDLKEDYDDYQDLMNLGPVGFYEMFCEEIDDWDPWFVAEYGFDY